MGGSSAAALSLFSDTHTHIWLSSKVEHVAKENGPFIKKSCEKCCTIFLRLSSEEYLHTAWLDTLRQKTISFTDF